MRKGSNSDSRLRIIGGRWRGRKLEFPALEGLRPTTDRVRETLFNWLAGGIAGARCLDVFAGSGALGLEALSRGANHCDFIDAAPEAIRAIRQHLKVLGATDRARVFIGDALVWSNDSAGYDIIFIDPPFASGLAESALARCVDVLNPGGLVYLEVAKHQTPTVPETLEVIKDKCAGDVRYRLLERQKASNLEA